MGQYDFEIIFSGRSWFRFNVFIACATLLGFFAALMACGSFVEAVVLLVCASAWWSLFVLFSQPRSVRKSLLIGVYSFSLWFTFFGWIGAFVVVCSPWAFSRTADDRSIRCLWFVPLALLTPLLCLAFVGLVRQVNQMRYPDEPDNGDVDFGHDLSR
jgi:hypothetical protein